MYFIMLINFSLYLHASVLIIFNLTLSHISLHSDAFIMLIYFSTLPSVTVFGISHTYIFWLIFFFFLPSFTSREGRGTTFQWEGINFPSDQSSFPDQVSHLQDFPFCTDFTIVFRSSNFSSHCQRLPPFLPLREKLFLVWSSFSPGINSFGISFFFSSLVHLSSTFLRTDFYIRKKKKFLGLIFH